ncbi:MAG: hypothetical protein JWN99_2418 [Ilumatobacteraceae bacterium]|nr:hypothetical protein [Ilumatobacteraceae bacterium]
MTVNMHIREVPQHVHDELQRRASAASMTLRQYTVKVLDEHCAVPTVDDWMDRVARRRARWLSEGRDVQVDAAQAVGDSRREDDQSRYDVSG